jgi:hypothetical protein
MVGRHLHGLTGPCVTVGNEGGGGDRCGLVEGEPAVRGSALRASGRLPGRIRVADAAGRFAAPRRGPEDNDVTRAQAGPAASAGDSNPDTAVGPPPCAARPDG